MSYILACVFIVKAIIMNFSEDWDVGILYLSTKFELDQFANNGDLLADRILWKQIQTHTQTEYDTLPISHIGSSLRHITTGTDVTQSTNQGEQCCPLHYNEKLKMKSFQDYCVANLLSKQSLLGPPKLENPKYLNSQIWMHFEQLHCFSHHNHPCTFVI